MFNENEDKESPFKSIIEVIKRGLYYVEKINNLSTSNIKNIKEKLVNFKNELFNNNNSNNNNNNNNNNRIKKDLNEYKVNKLENQKSDFYKTEKMKNKVVSEIRN